MRQIALIASLAGIAWVVALPLVSFAVLGPADPGLRGGLELPPSALAARLGLTLCIGAAVGAGSLALGLPAALALERTGPWRGRGAARDLVLIPLVLPPYLHAIAWIGCFAGAGPTPSPGGPARASWLFSPAGTLLVLIASLWPCAAWAAASGLRALDPRLEEAARLAGGPAAALRRVTLPMAMRHAAAGALFAAALAMAETGVPAIFGTPTLAAEAYLAFATGAGADAVRRLGLVLLVPIAAVAAAAALLARKAGGPARGAGEAPGILSGPGLAACLAVAASAVAASVVLPVASLVAGLGRHPAAAIAKAWDAGARDLGTTLVLALAGAAAATLLALATRLALDSGRGARAARAAVGSIAFAALALPGAVVGLGLIAAYNRPGLPGAVYGSAAIVVLAYAARSAWIPWAGLGAGMRAQGPGVVEAARLAGLPWWRVAIAIRIPLLRPELAAFFLLAFLFCFGELGSALLVHPPGVDVLPWRLFDLMHYAYDSTVAALGLTAVIACVATVALARWAAGRLARGVGR